jgi:hypothetical protein
MEMREFYGRLSTANKIGVIGLTPGDVGARAGRLTPETSVQAQRCARPTAFFQPA